LFAELERTSGHQKKGVLGVFNLCLMRAGGKGNKRPPLIVILTLDICKESGSMVTYRTLQQTGGKNGSSFLIILPKDWVIRQGLEKGNQVAVAERDDGCLIIDPSRSDKTGKTRSTTAPLEYNLRWEITSRYLLGFDEIRIQSESTITDKQRNEVKRIIKRFVALEVTEEDNHEIVLRCLVDPSTLPVRTALKQMNVITTRMIRDAVTAYFEGLPDEAEDIIRNDEEVDRLFFLIVRELRSAIQYPRMSEAMKITPVEALDFRLAAQYIERIADLAVDIAERVQEPIEKKLVKKLQPIVTEVIDMLSESVNILFKFNSKKVTSVIQSEKKLISETAKLRQHIISSRDGQPQTQLYVVDSLLRMGEAARDIADLALPLN
jgi:phosphate uptake regulator